MAKIKFTPPISPPQLAKFPYRQLYFYAQKREYPSSRYSNHLAQRKALKLLQNGILGC